MMDRKDDETNKEPKRVVDNDPIGNPKNTNESEPKEKEVQEKTYVPPPPYQPPIPFPQRLAKSKTKG